MQDRRRNLLDGVVAGSLATAISFFLRVTVGGPFLPEIAAQTVFSLTPGQIQSIMVETLGSLAKYLTIVGAAIVNVAVYGLVGAASRNQMTGSRVMIGLRLTGLSFLVTLLLSVPFLLLSEVLTQPTSIQLLAAFLLPPSFAFGFTFSSLHPANQTKPRLVGCKPNVEQGRGFREKRRLIIRTAPAGAVAAALVVFGLGSLFSERRPTESPASPAKVTAARGLFSDPSLKSLVQSEITPNELFYRVDVNVISPKVDPNQWRLVVKGLVNTALEVSYQELESMPAVEEYATLECISNEVGGDLISTALWRGVRLRDILEKAGARPEATYVVFRCSDGYHVGIPLERALLDGTILAYRMNGEVLPEEHGFPLRVVVPGLFGMMNAKWVKEVEVVSEEYLGFWQKKGWSNKAEYQTHSTIVTPGYSSAAIRFRGLERTGSLRQGRNVVAGFAFAGDRGISKVEVSIDGGETWEEASVKDPLSGYTWVLWAAEWNPSERGQYRLMVRATDKTGNIQAAVIRSPFPSGATGYHVVDIKVE